MMAVPIYRFRRRGWAKVGVPGYGGKGAHGGGDGTLGVVKNGTLSYARAVRACAPAARGSDERFPQCFLFLWLQVSNMPATATIAAIAAPEPGPGPSSAFFTLPSRTLVGSPWPTSLTATTE
jgi:hypothetical protein